MSNFSKATLTAIRAQQSAHTYYTTDSVEERNSILRHNEMQSKAYMGAFKKKIEAMDKQANRKVMFAEQIAAAKVKRLKRQATYVFT